MFNNKKEDIDKVVDSFFSSTLSKKLYIIDNSINDTSKSWYNNDSIVYIKSDNNGYGAGHNIALKKSINHCEFHVILNPDIYFEEGILDEIFTYISSNEEIGLVMPKVLYPNGELQRLCKLLPAPIHLIARKFIPIHFIKNKINFKYEMRCANYNIEMEVPSLSGCFMFIRTSVFNNVEMFDERFFMYLEDVDLSRRINEKYKTMYFPNVSIYHNFEKGSYKNLKLLYYHLRSAIKYFNKWGWLNDKKRKSTNKKIVMKIRRGK